MLNPFRRLQKMHLKMLTLLPTLFDQEASKNISADDFCCDYVVLKEYQNYPVYADILNSFLVASGDFCRLLITSANNLDPDQD